jgi:predicted Zn-dependent protease
LKYGADIHWARYAAIAALVALIGSGCTTDYVTGKRTFSIIGEDQEIEMGRQADASIVAQYGLYDDDAIAVYVDDLGQSVARVSHRPQLEYTIRVLDSPVVNAFALPGGWVYITRGILAHFNSEDELIGVLGHEIGHVTARHGAEQMSRQVLAGAGVELLGSLDVPLVGDVAGTSVGLLFLKFSRGQESESDRLGVEYATKLGYDSYRMADFFRTLARLSDQSGQSLPGFLSTHPDPGDREVTVGQLTDEWRAKVAYKPKNVPPEAFLRRIDGMVYGDDPRQGYVDGGFFYHPKLKFRFPVPEGWQLHNTPSVVLMVAPEQKAIIRFTFAPEKSASAAADSFIARAGAPVKRREAKRFNGLSAVAVEMTTTAADGAAVHSLSYFIQFDAYVLVFHGLSYEADWRRYVIPIETTMTGMARENRPSVLGVKPWRVRVKAAPRSGDMATVLRAMGVAEEKLAELAILNGRSLSEQVGEGERLKLIGR